MIVQNITNVNDLTVYMQQICSDYL